MAVDIRPPAMRTTARSAAGQAALEAAQALAKQATAPATLRAYKADWTHFSEWCTAHGFVAVPAAPATVGAYLASLAGSHAPTTIRRRLSALGKMHRFNDLPWNPAHRDIQGPLQGVLRTHGRPVQKAAALTLPMLRQILATCDTSARGRRDRALLLFGFVGALRRSELVSLRVEDVAIVAGGLRLRIRRGKTDQAGQGAEIGLPRGRHGAPQIRRPAEAVDRRTDHRLAGNASTLRTCLPAPGIRPNHAPKALPNHKMIPDRWGDWGLSPVNPVAAPLRMLNRGPACNPPQASRRNSRGLLCRVGRVFGRDCNLHCR